MNFSQNFKKNILCFFRELQNENPVNKTLNNDSQTQQLRELYIYIAVLVVIIIIILGGYAIYRKCVEKKLYRKLKENMN